MTTAADLNLTATQFANAKGIIAAVAADARFAGNPRKAATIAVETAMTESGMRMLASANVPESQKYPHERLGWTADGLGHDHASMGMFQQQTGYRWTPAGFGSAMNQTTMNSPDGWGTPAQLMNAQASTSKFLDALARVDWLHLDNWRAAQAVQHSASADGSNYRANDAAAQRIVTALWGTHTSSSGTVYELEDFTIMDKQTETYLDGKFAHVEALINHDGGQVVFGDSPAAATGTKPQSHPHNLTQIDAKVDALAAKLDRLIAKLGA